MRAALLLSLRANARLWFSLPQALTLISFRLCAPGLPHLVAHRSRSTAQCLSLARHHKRRSYLRASHISQSFGADVPLGCSPPKKALQSTRNLVCAASHLAIRDNSVIITRQSLMR